MKFTTIKIAVSVGALLSIVLLGVGTTKWTRSVRQKETPPANCVIVAKNGAGQFATIGEALRTVQPGMRIIVRPGTYNEALVIDKSVEIVADPTGTSEPVVLQTSRFSSITMRTGHALVRGFTIRHRVGWLGALYRIFSQEEVAAVDIPQGELVLEDCDIISNSVAGIAIHGRTAKPVIRRARIHDGRSNGLWFYGGAHGIIEDCEIFGTKRAGVRIEDEANPTLRRCKVHHTENAGIVVTDGGLGTIEDSEIWGNHFSGFESRDGSAPVIRRGSIHDSRDNGVYIHSESSATVEDCRIFNNSNVGVQITEDSSPLVAGSKIFNNAYSDLEISEGSDPVIKDSSIYGGQMSGIFVYQGGRGTIDNCDIFGHANFQEVVVRDESDPKFLSCRIHGGRVGGVLVLQRGAGTFEGCDIHHNGYAGVWIRTGSNPTIRNTKINENQGVAILSEANSAGSVFECNLTGNSRGSWSELAQSQLNRRGNVE